MFDLATRLKLRFQTDRGTLSTEDVWDLNLTQLNNLAKSLRRSIKQAEEEDFLSTKSEADKTQKLMFDVVIHVLETKKNEAAERETAKEKKAKRELVMGLLAQKQQAELAAKSPEELQKMLDEL